MLPGFILLLLLWSLLCGHSASTAISIFMSIFILISISISILLLPPCSLPTGAGGGAVPAALGGSCAPARVPLVH